jgi:flavodoxin
MSHPKTVILCKSVHHGSTAKVARVMAVALQAEVASPEEFPDTSLEGVGLVGFGSGVYYGRMHMALFQWLRGLPDTTAVTCPAFVFSTSGLPFLFKLWHAPLIRALSRKGFEVLGDFHCRGHDSWGPLWLAGGINKHHPDGRDLERASQFAAGISRKVWHDDVRQEESPKTFEMATLVSESIKP